MEYIRYDAVHSLCYRNNNLTIGPYRFRDSEGSDGFGDVNPDGRVRKMNTGADSAKPMIKKTRHIEQRVVCRPSSEAKAICLGILFWIRAHEPVEWA